jgi:hypothetical protein
MNSFIPVKTLRRGLVLISAAFLFGNGVLAAEVVGDAQSQARDLLSGTVDGRAKVVDQSPASGSDGVRAPALDPQEQARQLILGKPISSRIKGPVAALGTDMQAVSAGSAQGDHRRYVDPQESARRMILGSGARGVASPALKHSAALSQDPLVMRLDKDEFRIAFGINAGRFAPNGCNGDVRYLVNWKAEDGTTHSEIKRVNYTVLPGVSRTIAVDQQYFDTAKGEHTTDVVKVKVDKVTCLASRSLQTASTAAQAKPERTSSPVQSF